MVDQGLGGEPVDFGLALEEDAEAEQQLLKIGRVGLDVPGAGAQRIEPLFSCGGDVLGEHDRGSGGDRGVAAHVAAQFEAALAQFAVDDHDIGLVRVDVLERVVLGAGGEDPVSGVKQGGFELPQLTGLAARDHNKGSRTVGDRAGHNDRNVVLGTLRWQVIRGPK